MYLHELSIDIRRQIVTILDLKENWLDLAGLMDVTTGDILSIRAQSKSSNTSASDLFLQVWAARGYNVHMLYSAFKLLHVRRAATLLAPLLNESELKELDWGASRYYNSQRNYPPPSNLKMLQDGRKDVLETQEKSDGLKGDDLVTSELQGLITIAYSQLKQCTDEFSASRILGKGGYGIVYKGIWKDTVVAIKRVTCKNVNSDSLSTSQMLSQQDRERIQQTMRELRMLQMYRHDNILALYACSFDGPEPCLVYQIMVNGSLEDRLLCRNATPPLSWIYRAQILIGSCRALHFLHTVQNEPLIHGDVKSANILLDAFMQPKLGDFGLCRMGQGSSSGQEFIVSHIKGTLAYLPPEFMRNKLLSSKLDVYSFGVVIFEVLSGLRAYCEKRSPENLVHFALFHMESLDWKSEEFFDKMIDDKGGLIDKENLLISGLLNVAKDCVNKESTQRPTMKYILEELEKISTR